MTAFGLPETEMLAINVEGISHSFNTRRALKNVRFQVKTHSVHGFVGPNGAGKTTALKIICTLLRPQMGNVRVFGRSVLEDSEIIRRRLGFMPDHFSMYRQMTVFEYLDFFGAAFGKTIYERDHQIANILDLTDLNTRRDDVISGLSRGLQQRVSLARVLINDPDLLLLDEPASGLDPRARIELMDILRELRRMGKTIFISSHILSELAEICDSVTIIDHGNVKFSGPMQDLLAYDEVHPAYRILLQIGSPNIEQQLRDIKGVVEVAHVDETTEYRVAFDWTETDTNSLLGEIMDLGVSLTTFEKDRKHLNQAFMDLTEGGVN